MKLSNFVVRERLQERVQEVLTSNHGESMDVLASYIVDEVLDMLSDVDTTEEYDTFDDEEYEDQYNDPYLGDEKEFGGA